MANGTENGNEFQPFSLFFFKKKYAILSVLHFFPASFVCVYVRVCFKYILHDYWLFRCLKLFHSVLDTECFAKEALILTNAHAVNVELLVEIFFFKLENMPMINSISILVGINLIVIGKAYSHTHAHAHSHSKPNEMVSSGELSIQHFHIHILIEVKWLRLLACTVHFHCCLIIMIAH